MDPREQLLQSLMQDLQNTPLPERYSQAQKDQIMKGRKSQSDIDKGREEVRRNEELHQNAVTARGVIQGKIDKLAGDIETAKTKAAQDDPLNQAAQYGKSLGIPAAGYAAGHLAGSKAGAGYNIDPAKRAGDIRKLADALKGVDVTSPASKAQASGIVATYDKMPKGRGFGQFGTPGLLLGSSVATQAGADYVGDPYLKEGLNLAANAERFGGAGMLMQQAIDTLQNKRKVSEAIDPTDVARIEGARRQLNESGQFGKLQGPMAKAGEPAPLTPRSLPAAPPALSAPDDTPAIRRHSERLISAAKAAGASGALTKETAAAYLDKNLTDENRVAIAKELGVKSGPNFAKRVSSAVKNLATSRGAFSVAGPVIAGAMAYDAVSGDAEAAGASPVEATGRGAAAGGAAAGTAYGATKLAPHAIKAMASSMLGRAALRAVPPLAIGATAYDIGNYMGRSAVPAPENDPFAEQYAKTHPQFDPDTARMERDSERQRLQMPLENAASLVMPQIPNDAYYGGEQPEQPQPQPQPAQGMPQEQTAAISEAQLRQLANALASGDIAQRGDAFPQDPRRMQMVEALMGGAY